MGNETDIVSNETAAAAAHPAWLRLEEQLKWYDDKSQSCQKYYKLLKYAFFLIALSLPVLSFLPATCAKWATAVAGITIAFIEAVQQLNQYSTLWIMYRSTAERLKHEKSLFNSVAGPYRDLPLASRLVLLAERVEEHVSAEHANWFDETRRSTTSTPKGLPHGQ